jgi:hypothetical protein
MKKSFSKYSVVRATKVHNTLEIAEGATLVVSSCKSGRTMFTAFGVDARLSKSNFEIVCEPYKLGEEVVCIDPTLTLTAGLLYKVRKGLFSGEVRVTNDQGTSVDVLRSRFSSKLAK